MLWEALKTIAEVLNDFLEGKVPGYVWPWLGLAVVLVMISEMWQAFRKSEARKPLQYAAQMFRVIGISILSTIAVAVILIFIMSFLHRWLPALHVPSASAVRLWYAAVLICLSMVVQPLMAWSLTAKGAVLQVSLRLLHMLLLGLALAQAGIWQYGMSAAPVYVCLFLGAGMSILMFGLTKLAR